MYPKPDRSDYSPNFSKSPDNELIDIGWNEGFMSDGRPYRAECWAEFGATFLTFFFSTNGMENFSSTMFQKMLAEEGLVDFLTNDEHLSSMPITDGAGNDMWSITITIGSEDEVYARDSLQLRAYAKKKQAIIKPDYGLRLLKDGVSRDVDVVFYDFPLQSLTVLGKNQYSTTIELSVSEEMHALSLDFGVDILNEILARANLAITTYLRNELFNDPSTPRTIDFDGEVRFGVRARLGQIQTVEKESFIPLVAQEITT